MLAKVYNLAYSYLCTILLPSVARMILLPITQAHCRRPCPYRPRHTLIPIQTRSWTSRQRVA